MKKFLALLLSLAMILSVSASFAEMTREEYAEAKAADRSAKPRYLITTDLEVDDTNGVILAMLYSNEYDLAGIVWSAGMFHFSGDGEHTLGEITPHFSCPRLDAASYTEYRPVDPDLVPRLIRENYAHDYEFLSQNDPNYPTPEEMMNLYKVGNIAFEGDVRYDTEGSDWIKQCILDDDPRPLFITAWGGINTTVRALLSIYETYGDTPDWETIRQKVIDKVYLMGMGEDNCWEDQKMNELYPNMHTYGASGSGGYGNYFAALAFYAGRVRSTDDVIKYYQAEYLTDAFKLNHGKLMSEFHLMGDGQELPGEPDWFQPGLVTYIDWGGSPEAEVRTFLSSYERAYFDVFDWMCLQYNGTSFIDFGLRGSLEHPAWGTITGRITVDGQAQNRAANYRTEYNPVTGDVNSNYSTRFTGILFDELAARADWTCMPYEECNHAPIVTSEALDLAAKPGEYVTLSAKVTDPDGDKYHTTWWVWEGFCEYEGAAKGMTVWNASDLSANFTVPKDAQPGDTFNVLLQVQDEADRPMTRFAQFIITVAAAE
ncbi:MAG: DUF1593 domain-containing protein [Clostridia bacterium]|nr:DUF1593 domain-containing protein [Clostridia bacterium]